jgi:ADP-heptose:LPS heptosyltransferase
MPRLNIYDRRERALVAAADRMLALGAGVARPFRRRTLRPPSRILLLRLERIGDLIMSLPAVADVRALAPDAEIDLVVGSWNRGIAAAANGVTRVETLDARWLARDGSGHGLAALLGAARAWRRREYDLAINFEPDIRSNALLAAAGAGWSAGYASGGGGPLLDVALEYDPRAHTADNARRLVEHVFGRQPPARPDARLLTLPDSAVAEAARRLAGRDRPLVGVHASGGRPVKQWDPEHFADVAQTLAAQCDATIVLTGAAGDRPLVDRIKTGLPPDRIVDASGEIDLPALAAVLQRLDVFITGDTGPMHIAAAVGTPIVAIFGPSEPARYAPRGPLDRIVRIDLPCSPCNRIRLPPRRCVGHTPDCLSLLPVDAVKDAATSLLRLMATRESQPERERRIAKAST